MNDSIEKMQIFEVKVDEKEFRFILSSTCADGILNLSDIQKINSLVQESVRISKKRKIAEVDTGKEIKKTFFAHLE